MPYSDVAQSEDYMSHADYISIVHSNAVHGQMLVLCFSALLLSGFSLLGLLQTEGTLCRGGPALLPC